MILGLGNDIIEIERIKEAHAEHKQAFLNRLFTEKEQSYCLSQNDPHPRLAGRFAAKEAIAKALGCGFGAELSWKEIEILADESGKPVVHLSGELAARLAGTNLLVTISHCKAYASAVAIWQKKL
ncbi:MAG: holo-ACP synthase [Simkaniaceae bacterium]|nr:holo-ACP synthase [Candidatus Sacchlamyda saccharinae]